MYKMLVRIAGSNVPYILGSNFQTHTFSLQITSNMLTKKLINFHTFSDFNKSQLIIHVYAVSLMYSWNHRRLAN